MDDEVYTTWRIVRADGSELHGHPRWGELDRVKTAAGFLNAVLPKAGPYRVQFLDIDLICSGMEWKDETE